MRSPSSSYLDEAVLQKLGTKVFQPYTPKFWMCYVDDTLVILRRNAKEIFKGKLNSIFHQIQFTMDEEKDGEISFLDVQAEIYIGGSDGNAIDGSDKREGEGEVFTAAVAAAAADDDDDGGGGGGVGGGVGGGGGCGGGCGGGGGGAGGL
ncbi:hypothetical protein SprV_0200748400 [Sparganum proliferum]